MKEIENILFDFNGTLVDDVDLCLDLLNEMLVLRNHQQVDLKRYLEVFNFPVIEYYKQAGFDFPKDNFPELATYFIDHYSRRNIECSLYKNVVDVLKYFKDKGKNLVIISASEKNLLLSQLRRYGIDVYFSDISGLDNINASSKVESAKQFLSSKNYNLDKTVFIGDTLHDLEVSKEINVDCILISQGHQSRKRLEQGGCLVIDDIGELKDVLK